MAFHPQRLLGWHFTIIWDDYLFPCPYTDADVARVRFIAGARQLGFSLDDNIEILELRDRRKAPCRVVLNLIEQKANEIRERIAELERLEQELRQLRAQGLKFPLNDVDGKNCVCHLVSEKANLGEPPPTRSRTKKAKRQLNANA